MSTLEQHNPVQSYLPHEVCDEALRLTSAGLSIIPITAGGSKNPYFEKLPTAWNESLQEYRPTWKPFQTCIASPEEVREFYSFCMPGINPGIGIICGQVSGGLEVIDVDDYETASAYYDLILDGNPDLTKRLVMVKSPRPGLHVYYRCNECGRNRKLAEAPDPKKGGLEPKGLIEVKAEGGICLAPGSPPNCHRTGRPYQYLQHHLTKVPRITISERQFLEACARKLNRWYKPVPKRHWPATRPTTRHSARPGDDFNIHATWDEILKPKGWRLVNTNGPVGYWCRPGKQDGHSATTNYQGSNLLYVFSSNAAPFESETAYTKFAALALLRFGGNYKAAARHARSRLIAREANRRLRMDVSNQLRIIRVLTGVNKNP